MKFNKDKEFVSKMFDDISPTYDRLNHLLSGYQDSRWRKSAVKYLSGLDQKFSIVLDLAAGSGDLGLEFISLSPEKLYSVDISRQMLKINREKLSRDVNYTIRAEAEFLPIPDLGIDLCGIAFGVRNFQNLDACIKEISRVMKPGGKFVTIEMFKPQKRTLVNRSFKIYFSKILPQLGNKFSKSDYAYNYLFESVDNFITVKTYQKLLENNSFKLIKIKNNFIGFVHTVFAEKL